MSIVRPKISLLSSEQIEEVHSKSIELLSSTGIRMDSKSGRELLDRAIGKNSNDGFIRIPSELVEFAIKSAPSKIQVYNRNGEGAFVLDAKNSDKTYFGTGSTNLYYQDPLSDKVIPFEREHVIISTRLINKLNNFDIISTPGIIQDKTFQTDLFSALEMVANTTKPLVILVSDKKRFKDVLDLFKFISGEIHLKPYIIPYFNPITPLVFNDSTVDNIFTSIDYALPFIFSNYGMSGATTPITAAGSLVSLNAELLAGLVLSQLYKEGSQIIMGSLPSVFDNKNMISSFTAQTMLLNLACAEMMYYYGIPHCGTSGSGNGWGADLLASGTLWMNHLSSCFGKVGLAPFVGGNFSSLAYSPATVIYSDEIIRQAKLFSEGFELNDTEIAISEINESGPGGNFFTSNLTLEKFAGIQNQHSRIWPGYSFNSWKNQGSPKAEDILQQYTLDLLNNLSEPDNYKELISKGEEFILKCY